MNFFQVEIFHDIWKIQLSQIKEIIILWNTPQWFSWFSHVCRKNVKGKLVKRHLILFCSEFVKGAILQKLSDCPRFGLLNAKLHNLPLFYIFGSFFYLLLFVFSPFCLRKTFEQKYWSRKKNALRKSVFVPCHKGFGNKNLGSSYLSSFMS